MNPDMLGGLDLLLQFDALLYLAIGLVLGFVVGVLPGFGGANGMALVLPFALGLRLEVALLLLVGISAGALFAGAIPAILLNVPGTAGAAATALDGHPMAKAGKADRAIGIARMSSVAGGMVAVTAVLIILAPMAAVAQTFGSREMFVVAVFGLTVIATVIGNNVWKGALAAVLGLLIAAMSASPLTGQPRMTFGFLGLYDAVPFIPALIGLFAISEMLLIALKPDGTATEAAHLVRRSFRDQGTEIVGGIRDTFRYPRTIVRSGLIGAGLGIIPGIGAAVANFVSYGEAKKRSKNPERFGHGAEEGVVASEASDNGVTAGIMVPTLTLGIPGSSEAAVLLAALYLQGIQPGPRVMMTHGPEAYAVLLGLLVACMLILPVGILLAAPLTYVTRIPPSSLVPLVLAACCIGAFAVRNSLFDVGLAIVFGVLGFVLRRYGYSVIPLVLAMILGPIAEANFLRAMRLGQNSIGYFFDSLTVRVLWIGLAFVLLAQLRRYLVERSRRPVVTSD